MALQVLLSKNSKRVVVDVNRKIQKIWVTKMSWVKPIFNEVGLKCQVCTIIERKEKKIGCSVGLY